MRPAQPDAGGHFGAYGGRYVPEVLMSPLEELERIAAEALGRRADGSPWMEFQVDNATHSPVVLFHYPSHERTGFEYLKRTLS